MLALVTVHAPSLCIVTAPTVSVPMDDLCRPQLCPRVPIPHDDKMRHGVGYYGCHGQCDGAGVRLGMV
jgi:hypothetical protein